jgi:L-asparaginase / beta-aspartyl-peptidase
MSRCTSGWIVAFCLALGVAQAAETQVLTIVIHGGAGVIAREQLGPDGGAAYREGLNAALDAGYSVLESGGSSLDAVTAAVRVLEDNPLFNAGRGAVLNHEGEAELDASIMDGRDLRAGAIAGVKHVRNPIDLARRVMEHSPHVLLHGAGAEEFALQQ